MDIQAQADSSIRTGSSAGTIETRRLRRNFIRTSFLMSMKFNVHMSLLIQAIECAGHDRIVEVPYLLGTQKNADGSNLYNEFLSQPTLKSLDIAEKLKMARSTLRMATTTPLRTGSEGIASHR